MHYIDAPIEYDGHLPSIFLAGGITGCELWQSQISEMLSNEDIAVLNPRRENFPMSDPDAAEEQIRWEFRHLARATAALFWFPPQSLCPIALYELGKWSAGSRPLFVGTDPGYQRQVDVKIQTALARPDVSVVHSLQDLSEQVITHFGQNAAKPDETP